ncbi:MAG: hypothetical protein HYX34_14530 [Actinobacteria bacterium]|nr:hypothetical protein [Actinomycetota bacterium]
MFAVVPGVHRVRLRPDEPGHGWPRRDPGLRRADRLTQLGARSQTFDASGELCWTAATNTNPCGTPPAGATTYTYDPNGNRTGISPAGGSTTACTWNAANQLTGLAISGLAVISVVVLLLYGVTILAISLNRKRFERLVGPTIRAQYRFWARSPFKFRWPEATQLKILRVTLIACGAVFTLLGLVTFVVVARQSLGGVESSVLGSKPDRPRGV